MNDFTKAQGNTIITNLVERQARIKVEEKFSVMVDFGTVEFTSSWENGSNFYGNFKVTFHDLKAPYSYEVLGYISDSGFVNITVILPMSKIEIF